MFFNVNGTEWQIVYCNPTSKNLMRSDLSITLGVCDNNTKCVYINNKLSDYMFDKVLCHELVHVFCFENNLYLDIDLEEQIADFMSIYGRDIIYLADNLLKSLLRSVA